MHRRPLCGLLLGQPSSRPGLGVVFLSLLWWVLTASAALQPQAPPLPGLLGVSASLPHGGALSLSDAGPSSHLLPSP